MSKQLSLFAQDEWWMKVFNSFSEEKKAEAIAPVKALFIAEFDKRTSKGENHGEREN